MSKTRANGIELEYDCFGTRDADPLLLIMGLGTQMIAWREEFCEALADRGHFVLRFDNRDVGLSTRFGEHGAADIASIMQAAAKGEPIETAYSLDDMAEDAAGLLDALGIERAHVCGASMGGMIAQLVASRHPAKVKSLTSIMSTTGDPGLPGPRPEASAILMRPPAASRDDAIRSGLETRRVLGGKGFAIDETSAREAVERAYDRGFYPEGVTRQLAAIVAGGSRADLLEKLAVPTLVIHGTDDPLVPFECGVDTARRIPGAVLLPIEGMGHDLPEAAWGRIIDAIAGHAKNTAEAR